MLSDDERKAMLADGCPDPLDAAQAEDLDLFIDLLRDESLWSLPSTDLEDSVVRLIAAEAAKDTAGEGAPGANEPATVVPIGRARSQRRRRLLVPAVVAAAAVAAVVIGLVVARGSSSPAQFEAQLSATPLAPSARGSASISRTDAGFRIVLDAHGLAPLPAGEFYQAWLKNAQGTLVPIGSFSSSDSRVTLWSGVSPKEFSALSVTIEAPDGNQASSGKRVLAGPVISR